MTNTMSDQFGGRTLVSWILLVVWVASRCSAQDNGQAAAHLQTLVSGTLPNSAQFRAASTNITANSTIGIINLTKGAAANKSTQPQTGILRLGLSSGARDGYLFVPGSYNPQKRSAMILAIHAAGKGGLDAIGVLVQQANSSGVLLLAPDSRGATWDALPAAEGAFGPDVAFVGAALSQVMAAYEVNPKALGIQGFSDGATYALGLGMTNGNTFRKLMGNSPGGILAQRVQGQPPIYLSAGLQDSIFPIAQAGDADACYLMGYGYNVTYERFQGGHEVPPGIADDTMAFFLGTRAGIGSLPSDLACAP